MKYYKIIILFLLLLVVSKSFSQNDSLLKRFIQISGNVFIPTDYYVKYPANLNWNPSIITNGYDYYNLLGVSMNVQYNLILQKKLYAFIGIGIREYTSYSTCENYYPLPPNIYYNNTIDNEPILKNRSMKIYGNILLGVSYVITRKNTISGFIHSILPYRFTYDNTTLLDNSSKRYMYFSKMGYTFGIYNSCGLEYSYNFYKKLSLNIKIISYNLYELLPLYIGVGLKYKIK